MDGIAVNMAVARAHARTRSAVTCLPIRLLTRIIGPQQRCSCRKHESSRCEYEKRNGRNIFSRGFST